MLRRFPIFLVLLAVTAWPGIAQNKSLDAIMPGLSARIQSDWTGLTNIVCDETMTWSGGIVESEITAFRKIAIGYGIIESRQVKTINGDAIPKNRKPAEPFMSTGPVSAFAGVLPDNFTFKANGVQFVDGNPSMIVDFELRPDVKEKMRVNTQGTMWIATTSLHVLRFERKSESSEGRTIFETAEYGAIDIDGKPHLIPKTAKNEVSGRTGVVFSNDASYVAEYKNCRKSPRSPEQQIILPQQRFPQN